MLRDELIDQLSKHRNNDVTIVIPCESGKVIYLDIFDIHYNNYSDQIVIQN